MAVNFVVRLLLSVGMMFLGYLLTPKPKKEKPPEVTDLKEPTSEAGRPIPVLWGSITIESPNLIGAWHKDIRKREVRVGKK